MTYAQLVCRNEKVEFRPCVRGRVDVEGTFPFPCSTTFTPQLPRTGLVLVSELFPVTHNSHRVMTRHKIRW
jgi:hypothetical protein